MLIASCNLKFLYNVRSEIKKKTLIELQGNHTRTQDESEVIENL